MADLVARGAPWPGAVAVSGGGDSIALMHLLTRWAKATRRRPPVVVTVDHGLRNESAAEVRRVAHWARAAGLKHQALSWDGPRPTSDVEAAARQARYRLIGEWLRAREIGALYVGHTRDDQAETFLLRLMRGSGLDGLAAMRALAPYPVPGFGELSLVRPLLAVERGSVRNHLLAKGHAWLEDPMNGEDRFARVRLRKLMPALNDAGLTQARIAAAAAHLGRAREALDIVTGAVLARAVQPTNDGLHVDAVALAAAPREVGLRALAQVLMAVSGQSYRPRFERLERLFDRIAANGIGGGCTLHGCRLGPASNGAFGRGTLTVEPEFAVARGKKNQNRPKKTARKAR
jgi:tRNA(Ile)-lysidine synthase